MWQAKTKTDLMIEVWEKLDCEDVGAPEIEAIEIVVADNFGPSALESPMVIARLLADEGAELRHSEIMRLYVERNSGAAFGPALLNILRLADLRSALETLRRLESLRRKFVTENEREGLRLVRETALRGKKLVNEAAKKPATDGVTRQISVEISHWFSVWLQTPELFDAWVELRQQSADFIERFGHIRPESPS
jgi:hypothetical protein